MIGNKHCIVCKNDKAYSPIGVCNLFRGAEKSENGNIENILKNKHKYKELWELWHGSFLALVLYKKFEMKFNLCVPLQDPPDLYFIKDNDDGAFPVEIMELYKPSGGFSSYTELVEHIWQKKGVKKYDHCYLLLASRLNVNNFNLTTFVKEMHKKIWQYERIYVSFHNNKSEEWTFFEIFPLLNHNDKTSITFNLTNDKKYWY